jgi:hypothetical protein
MELVKIIPGCVVFETANMGNNSDLVVDRWPSLSVRRYVYHSVPVIEIFGVEEQREGPTKSETYTHKDIYRIAVPRRLPGRELFADNRRA